MNELIEKLINILEQEYTYYETLFNLSILEKKLILALDTVGLISSAQEKNNIAQKLQTLESERTNLVEKISKALSKPLETFNLKELIDNIDDEYKEKLIKIREKLQKKTEELAKINRDNSNILEKSLEFINLAMSRFRTVLAKSISYSRSGKNIEKVSYGALLQKEI